MHRQFLRVAAAADFSPFIHFGEDFVHGWILSSHVIKNLLNHLIPATLLFEVGASLVIRDGCLEAVGCDLVITVTHDSGSPVGEEYLGTIKLRVKQVNLLLAEALAMSLVLILSTVDVVADVVDLALSLLDSCVQLHSLLRCMLQVLLQVGDLAGELALGGAILRVLLLDLGQVLELDSLSFEDATLHILD